jgi:hypothetical protein
MRRHPIFAALLTQALAGVLIIATGWLLLGAGLPRLPALAALAGHSALATTLGRRLGLRRGWLVFQACFLPALIGLHLLDLPAWIYLAAFALILAFHWNSLGERVPLYLSNAAARQKLTALLQRRAPDFAFIDLGCGFGGTLFHLARHYPQARFHGVETAPLTFAIAWLRSLPIRNCRIRYRNLWRVPLTPYDVVYCFLSPRPMPAVWQKCRAELRPGALLVSNTFTVPDSPAPETIPLFDWRRSHLLVWQPNPGSALFTQPSQATTEAALA